MKNYEQPKICFMSLANDVIMASNDGFVSRNEGGMWVEDLNPKWL